MFSIPKCPKQYLASVYLMIGEQMKERLDELKALAPENVKGLNQTLKNDTVKVFIASFTQLYNASPLESYWNTRMLTTSWGISFFA